jgi:hypothetical protein
MPMWEKPHQARRAADPGDHAYTFSANRTEQNR